MNENDKPSKSEAAEAAPKPKQELWSGNSPRDGLIDKASAPGADSRVDAKFIDKPAGQFTTTRLDDGRVRIEGYAAKGTGESRDRAEKKLQDETQRRGPAGFKVDASHGVPYDQGARGPENLANKGSVVNRSYDASFERNLRHETVKAHERGEGVYVMFTGTRTEDGSLWSHCRTEVYRGNPETGMEKVMDYQGKGDWFPSAERLQEHERMLKAKEALGETVTEKDRVLEMPTLNTVLGHDHSARAHGALIDSNANKRMAGGQMATEWNSPKRPPQETPMH